MLILAGITLTCWLCALLAAPRKPLRGNEVQELVYSRLLGRQQMLMLLALIVTGVALVTCVITIRPNRVDADLERVRPKCQWLADGRAFCNTMGQDGHLTKIIFPGEPGS